MVDLTLEEYRNLASHGKDVNQFLREEAEKSFGADFGKGGLVKKAYARCFCVRPRRSWRFSVRGLHRIKETAEKV